MRVIVCGSRDYTNFTLIEGALIDLVVNESPTAHLTVVAGGARGADALAAMAARGLRLTVEEHPADWVGRGRVAGFERNKLMASLGADLVLAFKDDMHPTLARGGTEHMVKLAIEAGIPVRVYSNGARFDR